MQHNAEQNPEHPACQKYWTGFVKIMDPPTALHCARVEDVAQICWQLTLIFAPRRQLDLASATLH
jgi:hypothetical protein